MRQLRVLLAILALGVAAWVGRDESIAFGLEPGVRSVLNDWRAAGLSCGDPSVGMPGPMIYWGCTGEFDGVTFRASVEADPQGVFGIHASVPAATSGATTARAFVTLVRATSLIRAAEAEMERWLMSSDAADGAMPVTSTTGIRRAHVDRDSGHPILFVVPLGSSMEFAK